MEEGQDNTSLGEDGTRVYVRKGRSRRRCNYRKPSDVMTTSFPPAVKTVNFVGVDSLCFLGGGRGGKMVDSEDV